MAAENVVVVPVPPRSGVSESRSVIVAAAKKAFMTTRIGDLGFLIGMLWLYADVLQLGLVQATLSFVLEYPKPDGTVF